MVFANISIQRARPRIWHCQAFSPWCVHGRLSLSSVAAVATFRSKTTLSQQPLNPQLFFFGFQHLPRAGEQRHQTTKESRVFPPRSRRPAPFLWPSHQDLAAVPPPPTQPKNQSSIHHQLLGPISVKHSSRHFGMTR